MGHDTNVILNKSHQNKITKFNLVLVFKNTIIK